MKKLLGVLCLCLCPFILLGNAPSLVNANGASLYASYYTPSEFLRVVDSKTPFYSDFEGRNLMFYLPYTYYVKVLEKGTALSHVEIVGDNLISLDGFVPTEMLFDDDLAIASPYVNLSLKIKATATLYSTADCSAPQRIIYNDRDLRYYGTITRDDGSRLFYVSYYNKVGYVNEADVMPFTIPNHPNELTFLQASTPEQTPPDASTDNEENQPSAPTPDAPTESNAETNLRIIIFGVLLLAGGLALIFVLKNKGAVRQEGSYYDENDYE